MTESSIGRTTRHLFLGLVILSSLSIFLVPVAAAFVESGLQVTAKEIVLGRAKRIVVTFKDPSYHAGPISAHVYFIGKAPNGGARFIYAHCDLSVSLRGMPETSTTVEVPDLKTSPTRRAPHGYALIGIGDSEGWIVIGQSNGKRVPARASNSGLLAVAQGSSIDSLDAMIIDYQKRSAAPARHPM